MTLPPALRSELARNYLRLAEKVGLDELVQLVPSSLPKRTQRGGKFFAGAAGKLVSDFATLFQDRIPADLAPEMLRTLLERLSPEAVDEAFQLVRPTSSLPSLVVALSKFACRLLPACRAETVSEDVANRLGTTLQGAHAWMVRPLLFASPPANRLGLIILEKEAEVACRERGNAGEMLQWFPDTGILGVLSVTPISRINKGCKKGLGR